MITLFGLTPAWKCPEFRRPFNGAVIAVLSVIFCGMASAGVSDRDYYESLSAGTWVSLGRDTAAPSGPVGEMGWSLRDGKLHILWPTPTGMVARAVTFRLRDAKSEAGNVLELQPVAERQADRVRLTQQRKDWKVEFEAVFIPRGTHLEAAVRLRGLGREDVPLRVEFAMDTPGQAWTWWDDARHSRPVTAPVDYANVTRVLAGYDGQMSRYPYACLSSGIEALAIGVPLLRPRVFQLVYDGKASEFRLAVDFALSPSTAKFSNETTFFFVLYPTDPAFGFRGAIERYSRIYPEPFIKRVEREGVWMPFTRINDVRDAQDFHFGFHEYGAVDFDYNARHGIYSFLYVEPWTYWMAMEKEVPRETTIAMEQLKRNAAEGDEWNRSMAKSTLSSAVYDTSGQPVHQFVDQPWCSGTLFFNNSDPDIPLVGEDGINAGRLNLDIARRSVVENEHTVVRGWDSYGDGFEVDREVTRDAGTGSIRIECSPGGGGMGAFQSVVLDQDESRPIWISGFSRAEKATPGAAENYSLYADLTYQNGSNSWGHAVGFDAGASSWQHRELVIFPEAPVKTVKLHALFRGERYGQVWFDEVELKELPSNLAVQVQSSPWEAYERGFVLDEDHPHGGRYAMRVDRSSAQSPGGSLLRVKVDQRENSPLEFKVWSRSSGSGNTAPDDDYALFADVYFHDGTAEFGITTPISRSGRWREYSRVYQPSKPVKSIHLHLLFRGAHTGTAWFDDVSVVDGKSGWDYVVDGGFERAGSSAFALELQAIPNRIFDGTFAGDTVQLRPDGMYLDSMEGWANRLNFRAGHFAAADIPLAYETGSGRTAIFNLFSIFEFTRAMAEYLHAHDRLLMGNWVLIDYPFLGALLDVPGKEVHWLNSNHAFTPDPDDVMLYRRSLSGQKPYPLLLNVRFEHFTPVMMRKYFDRSLFYAFYPGMFSHDAASHPYFENPALYDRDRDLFLSVIPIVRALSSAGWEPLTHAVSSDSRILVERYGRRAESGLYFTIHHDGEGWGRAATTLDLTSLEITNAVRLIDVRDGSFVPFQTPPGLLTFASGLEGYGTRVVRVIEDDAASLVDYGREKIADLRAMVERHEAQGKMTPARAAEWGGNLGGVEDGMRDGDSRSLLKAAEYLRQLKNSGETRQRPDAARAVAAAENAVTEMLLKRIGLSLIASGGDVLVSPSDMSCDVEVINHGYETFTLSSVRFTFEPETCAGVATDDPSGVRLPPGRSHKRSITLTVPPALDADVECTARLEVTGEMASHDEAPRTFTLVRNTRVRFVPGFDLKLTPERMLTTLPSTTCRVVMNNHQDQDVTVRLAAGLNGPDRGSLSWTQQTVLVKAGQNLTLPLIVTLPDARRRADYQLEVTARSGTASLGFDKCELLRFPESRNLIVDTNVDVRVDSTFAGYSTMPLRDGIIDTEGLAWSESAWASADIAVPHWVEMRWPAQRRISGVTIHWAEDGGTYFRSTNYRLQYKRQGQWVDFQDVRLDEGGSTGTRHTFTPLRTDALRLWQETGGGPDDRQNLLWIRELEVRDD